MSKKFEREHRYLVFKIVDALQHLTQEELDLLERLREKVAHGRHFVGQKPPLDAVAVERDWPEYELVWNMIEERASASFAQLMNAAAELEDLANSLQNDPDAKAKALKAAQHYRERAKATYEQTAGWFEGRLQR